MVQMIQSGKTLPSAANGKVDEAIKLSTRIGKAVTDLKLGIINKATADIVIGEAQAELDKIIQELGASMVVDNGTN